MEKLDLRPSDWIGVLLIALIGLLPVLATLGIAWWILVGGEP
jgi:hypothetical protein